MKLQSLQGRVGHWRSSTAALAPTLLCLLSLQTQIRSSYGFTASTLTSSLVRDKTRHPQQSLLPLNSQVQTPNFVEAPTDDGHELPKLTGSLANSRLQEFDLKEHKPLGCSVEESLADEEDGAKYVFVAEVAKGGNAAKAGIKVGDVIVQLSGTFDEVVGVAGLGIDKIRSLVGGRPDGSSLVIRVARGSDIMERHELALVELCIIGDDATTAECISAIYTEEEINIESEMAPCDEDDDTECMLDSMWGVFTEGLPTATSEEDIVDDEVKEVKKKVAPWSSRSSGSGTYVRNPKTGKMENIDE